MFIWLLIFNIVFDTTPFNLSLRSHKSTKGSSDKRQLNPGERCCEVLFKAKHSDIVYRGNNIKYSSLYVTKINTF